ncbi:phosphoesterase family-domain-containing protein [Lipomyces orientalis]|uniref:Phosphoesterase family-domain-containing protein n=1 Tax=Lipomyces orientalis TaxID=1233043 RepID=A0ACC3TTH3_9ASCO
MYGTTDDNFYDHYSEISTVEANWDLPNLGRGDAGANVFALVANETDVTVQSVDFSNIYNNQSGPGYFNDASIPIPAPNLTAINSNGKGVLDSIVSVWGSSSSATSAAATTAAPTTTTTDPAPTFSSIKPSLSQIEAAAATVVPEEYVSSVSGKAFDRFVIIWLENTDYDAAFGQSDLTHLAESGILLTNYFAATHPSEPNYVASVGGDYFGIDSDAFLRIPENVSTIVDLLDTKGISWAEYQEDLPYAGYEGFNFSDQTTYANNYVRKHNPLVIYDSIANNASRLNNIKNFTSFYDDLANEQLPQWMFITPNELNDGHDTTVDYTGNWTRSFIEPLMNNTYFWNNTLVLITFDENESYAIQNRVWALLMGGAVPTEMYGTTDDNFYDHYSEISTVEANWDLPNLGRGDAGANVFALVANETDVTVQSVDFSNIYNNQSGPGYFNDASIPIPAPNLTAVNSNGQGVLDSIVSVWGTASAASTASASATASTSTAAAAATSSSAAEKLGPVSGLLGLIVAAIALM